MRSHLVDCQQHYVKYSMPFVQKLQTPTYNTDTMVTSDVASPFTLRSPKQVYGCRGSMLIARWLG
jgi:hypothetical protein